MIKLPNAGGEALAKAVEAVYERGETDYSLKPLNLVDEDGKALGLIKAGDSVIFCCRRGERETELTDAFTEPDFSGFEREELKPLDFVILTMYSEKYTYLPVAFAPSKVHNTLAQTISKAGKTQLHCAESEKFAHVTFFFNGGEAKPIEGETDIKIQSLKGIPFERKPEMRLPDVADEVIKGLVSGYDFIITNFANGDVIGHTSNCEAKVAAAEAVSRSLGVVLEAAKREGYTVLVTADHGNLEVMRTKEGKPHVAHTTNLVYCAALSPNAKVVKAEGKLADVAPTVLSSMGLDKPDDMTGSPLFEFEKPAKTLLIVLDGWGKGEENDDNPIFLADTPVWDALIADNPTVLLRASGDAVGLEPVKAGNSEAGHINLGAGRVILQDDVRLDAAMRDGSFGKNPAFVTALENARERGGALHLIGLLTKKSSHGSMDYPLALLGMAKERGFENVCVHIIFDGRSTEPGSAPALLRDFGSIMEEKGVGCMVSGVGRGVALDRDRNWDKVKCAYNSMVLGIGQAYRK